MRLLLDEHIEHEVYGRLVDDGHDVTHVEQSDRIQKGADDAELAELSLDEQRVIVTYDDDFRLELTEDAYYGVILVADETIKASAVAQILQRVATYYERQQLRGVQTVGRSWL